MPHRTQFIGKAGEHMVASQLLLRGIEVAFPAVDNGIDLIAGKGIRIQVKAARKITQKRRGQCGYHFNVAVNTWSCTEKKFYGAKRNWSEFVDFFVFWGIDENRFWIVPAALIKQSNVRITDEVRRFVVDSDSVKALLSTGLNQREVSARLGISEMSVSRVVNGITPKTLPGVLYEVMKREGAWNEIISAVGLTSSIDRIELDKEKLTTHA